MDILWNTLKRNYKDANYAVLEYTLKVSYTQKLLCAAASTVVYLLKNKTHEIYLWEAKREVKLNWIIVRIFSCSVSLSVISLSI